MIHACCYWVYPRAEEVVIHAFVFPVSASNDGFQEVLLLAMVYRPSLCSFILPTKSAFLAPPIGLTAAIINQSKSRGRLNFWYLYIVCVFNLSQIFNWKFLTLFYTFTYIYTIRIRMTFKITKAQIIKNCISKQGPVYVVTVTPYYVICLYLM